MNKHISFGVVTTIILIILALVGLGFAAMSTSTHYDIHPWVPILFFVFGGIAFLVLVIYLLLSIRKNKLSLSDDYSGYVYIGEKLVSEGLQVMAKIGTYNSRPVTTNADGYYFSLVVSPPNNSYINRTIEFYVDGQKASETNKFWPGRGRAGFDLHVPQVLNKEGSQN